MSAYAITGKITCINGDVVQLTPLQQTIVSQLGRRFDNRDQLVTTLKEWEQKLSGAVTPYLVTERMKRIMNPEPAQAVPASVALVTA